MACMGLWFLRLWVSGHAPGPTHTLVSPGVRPCTDHSVGPASWEPLGGGSSHTSSIAGVIRIAAVRVRGPCRLCAQRGQDAVPFYHSLFQQQRVKLDCVVAAVYIWRGTEAAGQHTEVTSLEGGSRVGPKPRGPCSSHVWGGTPTPTQRSSHAGLTHVTHGEGFLGRARQGGPGAASPVIRAGYHRPSCRLARHAEPACRELRSGSWKGRSSSTETTCPCENLQRGPHNSGMATRVPQAQRIQSTCLDTAPWRHEWREGHTCPVIYRQAYNTQLCTSTLNTTCIYMQHPHVHTPTHIHSTCIHTSHPPTHGHAPTHIDTEHMYSHAIHPRTYVHTPRYIN